MWLGLPPFSVLVRVPAYCGIWLDIKPTTLSQNKGIALSFLIILFAWKLVKGSKKAFERNWFLVLWSFEISRQRIAKYFRNPPGLSCWMDQHYNNSQLPSSRSALVHQASSTTYLLQTFTSESSLTATFSTAYGLHHHHIRYHRHHHQQRHHHSPHHNDDPKGIEWFLHSPLIISGHTASGIVH